MTYDIFGLRHPDPVFDELIAEQLAGMMFPVRCVCGQVYDLAKVTVTGRWTDCTAWNAPCCKRQADDRYETGWSAVKHYTKLDRNGREVQR